MFEWLGNELNHLFNALPTITFMLAAFAVFDLRKILVQISVTAEEQRELLEEIARQRRNPLSEIERDDVA